MIDHAAIRLRYEALDPVLDERGRRRFAAAEALAAGWGGVTTVSRITGVARATVAARLQRLEDAGIVTGYGPDIDVTAAGFGVQAFVTLEIAQGALAQIAHTLNANATILNNLLFTHLDYAAIGYRS